VKNRKIFITGIAGFIGYHCALKLSALGYTVSGIDNFNDYYDVSLKEERKKRLEDHDIKIFKIDLVDFENLKACIEAFNPNQILHLAAQAGVRYSLENPKAYMASNCTGFFNLLEILKVLKIPCVYASSSSVYGAQTHIPFSEELTTDTPLSLYAATKKSNELFAYAYHHLFQIPLIGLRFFTAYGTFGRPDMAYFSFTDKILAGDPITVYDGGLLERDFTHISDIVDGIVSALNFPVSFGVFNLGNHKRVKVIELISLIEKYTGKKAIIHEAKKPSSDVQVTYADLTKSKEMLNFNPKVSIDQGMEEFIKWHQNFYLDNSSLNPAGK
jgi:UDP-glucuronate 4-epimerase